MKSMQQLCSRENLKTFLIWNVGAFITAVGAYFFKYPNHFSFGGVSGITVVMGHYFPNLSLSGINWVLNLALLVLGVQRLIIAGNGTTDRRSMGRKNSTVAWDNIWFVTRTAWLR